MGFECTQNAGTQSSNQGNIQNYQATGVKDYTPEDGTSYHLLLLATVHRHLQSFEENFGVPLIHWQEEGNRTTVPVNHAEKGNLTA